MKRLFVLLLLMADLTIAAPSDPALQSPVMVQRLTALLTSRHLDAIAAQVPNEADRFVAALFYPDTQLLVISARAASPRLLLDRLSWKQYREVYLDLQSGAIAGSSWFLYDMKADGLASKPADAADTFYEGDKPAVVFDGDPKKHGLAATESEADRRYSELLAALIAEAEKS